MLGITIEAVNAREVTMNMAGFASDVSDLTPVWSEVAPVLEAQTAEKFASEGAAGEHGEWAELSPDYGAWKEKHFPGMPILQRGGGLLDSFTEGGADHVDRRTETVLEWGSAVPYSVYHQMGYRTRLGTGRRKPKEDGLAEVPARRQIDPSDGDIDQIRRAIQIAIVQMVRRRGFGIASQTYGPGEMQEITGGEAFQIGKSSLLGGS
jgi:phage gpG-like protein